MHRNKVIAYLQDYVYNKKRVKVIDDELVRLSNQLYTEMEHNKYDVLKSFVISDMPHGNAPISPVEKWWDELEKRGGLTARAIEIRKTIKALSFERCARARQVMYVKKWSKLLRDHELFILRHIYVYPHPESLFNELFYNRFGYVPEANCLRKIKNRALNKLAKDC